MLGSALFTAGLWLARNTWLRFPLHPLGYLVATAYGDGSHLWFPFLLVWVVKGIVLRISGARGFRKLIPGFVGFALGHFIFGGTVWTIMRMFLSTSITERYGVIF